MLPISYMGAPSSDYIPHSFCAFLHCCIFVLEIRFLLCCQGWLSSYYEVQASLKVFIFLLQPPSARITSKCYHAQNYILAFSTPLLDLILCVIWLAHIPVHHGCAGVPNACEGQDVRSSGAMAVDGCELSCGARN